MRILSLYDAIMKIIKQLWIITFSIVSIFVINLWYGFGLRIWPVTENFAWDSSPVVNDQDIENINEWWETFSRKLDGILWLPQKDDYATSLWYVTTLVQVLINWLLWILAFVALVYMLYCGFLVLFSWSDDKNASKGKKWISTAAIALAWIWLSWLIVSAMIWFINIMVPQG